MKCLPGFRKRARHEGKNRVHERYDFHPEAEIDLDEVWEYIAADNLSAADQSLEALVPFPQQGHRRTDLTNRPLRFTRVRDYLIAYAPDEQPLWVMGRFRDNATTSSLDQT